jgi:putative two-component system response regulator
MPTISGLDLLCALRADHDIAHLPILVLTASDDRELRTEALEAGATDFLSKPVHADDLIPRVRNALLIKQHHDKLEELVRERTAELEESRKEVVLTLGRAAEQRDDDTGSHVVRVGRYVGIVARQLGIDDATATRMELAAILHDVGKIGVPDSILLKPGRLTEEEFEAMKEHCQVGGRICDAKCMDDSQAILRESVFASTVLGQSTSPLLRTAATIALTHHERWDGTGYPRGLQGEAIPIEGRITAIADVFDALSNQRPYKPAFPLEECFDILRKNRGSHFDPRVVDAFFSALDEIVAVYSELSNAS